VASGNISIVTVPAEQNIFTYERKDELSISVKWFDCRTFKSGVAFAHLTYSTIQNKCGSV